jgi:regulator of replication initiation timing
MELAKQQLIYDHISTTSNKDLWAVAGDIARQFNALVKENTKLEKENAKLSVVVEPEDVTDDQLRRSLRSLLVAKLKDQSLSAPEIAQLKDIFGLTNAKQDITISIVSYADCDTETTG